MTMTLINVIIHCILIVILVVNFIKSGPVTMTMPPCDRDFGTEEECYYDDARNPKQADGFRARCDSDAVFARVLCCASCMQAFSQAQFRYTTPANMFNHDPDMPVSTDLCPPRSSHNAVRFLGFGPAHETCLLFANGRGHLRVRRRRAQANNWHSVNAVTVATSTLRPSLRRNQFEVMTDCYDLLRSTHPVSTTAQMLMMRVGVEISKYWLKGCATECGLCHGLQ